MLIQSQDKDILFSLPTKPLFSGIYTKDIYVRGKFFGTNIYGKTLFGTYLLGTYEPEESEQVISEIFKLHKKGILYYVMPAPSGEFDSGVFGCV